MYCSKCGHQNPEGCNFCASCGAPISGEGAYRRGESASDAISEWARSDYPRIFIVVGCFLMILGAFLPYVGGPDSDTLLGVNWLGGTGAALCLLSVLCLAALVLSRSGASGRWDYVMLLFSALAFALIFQFLYFLLDNDAGLDNIGYGYWITLSGTGIMTLGALGEVVRKNNTL